MHAFCDITTIAIEAMVAALQERSTTLSGLDIPREKIIARHGACCNIWNWYGTTVHLGDCPFKNPDHVSVAFALLADSVLSRGVQTISVERTAGHHQTQAYFWLLVSRADAKRYFNLTDAYIDARESPAADDSGAADESVDAGSGGANEALNAGADSHGAGADSPGDVLHAPPAPPTTRASMRNAAAPVQRAAFRASLQHFGMARAAAIARAPRE